MGKPVTIQYYERGSQKLCKEQVLAGGFIASSYKKGKPGGWFTNSLATRLLALYYKSFLSKLHIKKVIKTYNVDTSEFRDSSFGSFNAFFTRRLKPGARDCDQSPNVYSCPADGRILVYPKLADDEFIPVKGAKFRVQDLLGRVAREYRSGALATIRLCPGDYHRFHFPCGGDILETRTIKGAYHSVNPIALGSGVNVFCANKRSFTVIKSKYFGRFCYLEVGAFGVGSIVQTFTGKTCTKMREKGYFQYGGSTIILIFEPGMIRFSDDLVNNSAAGHETRVLTGETIGIAVNQE